MLITIYFQAALYGDLWSDPNWTISNVMVYPCNEHLTNFVMFPAFLTMCIVYSLKLDILRVRLGSIMAVIGGVGLIGNPVTTNRLGHTVFALVTFLSSWFWYPECNETQLRIFVISSVLFVGGALLDWGGIFQLLGGFFSYLPSVCCMTGEMGIFVTWGCMLLNPPKQRKD